MASDFLQDRLRMLRRSLARRDLAAAAKIVNQTAREAVAAPLPRPRPKPLALAKACAGAEMAAPRGGRFWLIRKTLAEFSPRLAGLSRQYAAILRGARQRWDELEASPALCQAADGEPQDLLFLDIESCGLIPAPVFLIGLMSYVPACARGEDISPSRVAGGPPADTQPGPEQDPSADPLARADGRAAHGQDALAAPAAAAPPSGQLLFEQYLARDYSEEAAILRALAARLPRARVLVTFNGKTFDMNLLRQRAAFHGVDLPGRLAHHLDLLHESRKRWRGCVPDCRLQTLEQYLCGRRRVGDIPGAMIAEAYHSFVRSGDARPLADILHHNLLDLLTMGELLCHLLTGAAPADESQA